MGALRTLAGRLAAIRDGRLPGAVLDQARLCLLDTLGCGVYGSGLDEGRRVVAALGQLGGGGAPVWGCGALLARSDCALACGALAHLRELDDVHWSITHPGAVVVPALHALAWGRDGRLGEALAALVAGYEAMVRVSRASGFLAHRRKGWHATATMGPFGAAAACGVLLGLEPDRLVSALGLAGSRTGGTWAFKADGAMSKRLHPGLAARDGLTAACLARSGITGPEYVLEAEDGGSSRSPAKGGTWTSWTGTGAGPGPWRRWSSSGTPPASRCTRPWRRPGPSTAGPGGPPARWRRSRWASTARPWPWPGGCTVRIRSPRPS